MPKPNPFDEIAAANEARFRARFLGGTGERVTDHRVDPLFAPKDALSISKMQECVKMAAGYRAGLTGIDAARLEATISVNELLAADSPMDALEKALDAGEAKIREASQ